MKTIDCFEEQASAVGQVGCSPNNLANNLRCVTSGDAPREKGTHLVFDPARLVMLVILAVFACVGRPASAAIVIFDRLDMGAGGNGVSNARTQDFRRIDLYPTILEHDVASGQATAYSRVSYLQNGNVTTLLHDFEFTREAGPSSFAYIDRFWSFTPTTPMNYELSGYMQIDSSPNDVVFFSIGLIPLNSIGLFGYGSEYYERNDYREFGFESDGTFIDYTGTGQSNYSGSPAGVLAEGTNYTMQSILAIAVESADITVPATARGRITLTLTAVPEPSFGMLLGIIGCTLASIRRRQSPG